MPPKSSKRGRDAEETKDLLRFGAHRSRDTPLDDDRTLTPMEKQVLSVKRAHPDTVLLVECGYKMIIYGRDAEIASKFLGIQCFRKDSAVLDNASIPVGRTYHHMAKLVEQGYKVGTVRQTETASARAEEGGKGVFERSMTACYTRGTWTLCDVPVGSGDGEGAGETTYVTSHNTKHAIALILELPQNHYCVAWTSLLDLHGTMLWESFVDTPILAELETRLRHIDPCDILTSKNPSSHLLAMLKGVFGLNLGVDEEHQGGTVHYETFTVSPGGAPPEEQCKKALGRYMAQFGLVEYVTKLERACNMTQSTQCAMLPATTFDNLEIFTCTDGSDSNTLFSFLCRTKSAMGARELKRWIRAPLVDPAALEQRQAQVAALEGDVTYRTTVQGMLLKPQPVVDLEVVVQKAINSSIRPCGVKMFARFLRGFVQIALAIHPLPDLCGIDKPTIIAAGEVACGSLRKFQDAQWDSDDCASLFLTDANSDEAAAQKLEAFLENEHKVEICTQLKISKADFTYSTVSGVGYLIEVTPAQESRVPKEWMLENRTKTMARYQTDTIKSVVTKIAFHREKAKVACVGMWRDFVTNALGEGRYETYRKAIQVIARLDCLVALAEVAGMPGYVRPRFLPEGTSACVQATEARHPILEQLCRDSYVPNDIRLNANGPILLTGPNMGGKSVYLKMIGVLSLMAQIGSYVPAAAFSLTPFDAFFSRMGSRDDAAVLRGGRSTFMYEMTEASEILRLSTHRSLVLLDEIGRGTSTFDGTAIAFAVLAQCINQKCVTVFVTHFPVLTSLSPPCDLFRMGFAECSDDVTLLYKVCPGVSPSSFGMNVAKMAGLPDAVVKVAQTVSNHLRARMDIREALQKS